MKIRLKNQLEDYPAGTEIELVKHYSCAPVPEAQFVGGKYRIMLPPSPKGWGLMVVLVSEWEVEVLYD